ncbi:MAG: arsenic resistance N-acetyltransferase ArsN2 [Pseudomonadota bacterium]
MKLTFRDATEKDWVTIRDALSSAALPTDDLSTAVVVSDFRVAESDDGRWCGAAAVQRYGSAGLLRSVIVSSTGRGAGLGRRIVADAEAHARQDGIEELWLLTIDADAFFATLGYEPAARGSAPVAVRESAEFASLCPDDAVPMRKRL